MCAAHISGVDKYFTDCTTHSYHRSAVQRTPLVLSFSSSSSTSATFDPASRVGGSATPTTSIRGEMSTPSSPAVSFAIGFFLAFYREDSEGEGEGEEVRKGCEGEGRGRGRGVSSIHAVHDYDCEISP